jgi:hypothetical protein
MTYQPNEERAMNDKIDDWQSEILNPEAVGDPNQTPIVLLSTDLVALLNPCQCGGVNGFHKPDCASVSAS